MITAEAFFDPACQSSVTSPDLATQHLQSLSPSLPPLLLLHPATQTRRREIDALLYDAGVAAATHAGAVERQAGAHACAFVY
jgi:hypothetical protein